MKPFLLVSFLAVACMVPAHAALIITTDNAAVDIADGSSSGVARLMTIAGSSQSITSATVSLEIGASPGKSAFLGDLYVYLSNGTNIAVLLNRPGRSLTAPAGYGDDKSMNVTFSDAAVGDIHNYRTIVTGNASTPLSNPLTGTWLPDGRAVDPANVLDASPSTARLDSFIGAPADGDWRLFVADLSGGGEHRLVSWTLTLETVPEPSALVLLTLGVAPVLLRRRRG